MKLFLKDGDFEAFERYIERTIEYNPMRILAFNLMPNHWHFVVHPEGDEDLPKFMHRLTITHVSNWQRNRHRVGYGHLYQSRYKLFPVDTDEYFYSVIRYVERNALRAKLVQRAEDWRWSSLWHRVNHSAWGKKILSDWPLPIPSDWAEKVNSQMNEIIEEKIRACIMRSCPFGNPSWVESNAKTLGLEAGLRPRGRPWKRD